MARRTRRASRSTPSTATDDRRPEVQEKEEAVVEDHMCPVCQLLLFRPVTTRCNHTLCESCMAHWADVSVTSQMTIVSLDEQPSQFNPIQVEAKCPMCRTLTTARLDPEMAHVLSTRYPRKYAERRVEEQTPESAEASSMETLTLYIGNSHRLVEPLGGSGNQHDWTFFVRPSRTDIIEEVHILLHPTFRPSRIIRTFPPYEIRRLGWGYFTIEAFVILKAGYSWVSEDAEPAPDGARKGMLPLEWTLDFDGFDGKGSMGRWRLKVRGEAGLDEEEEDRRAGRRTVMDELYVPPAEE